MTEPVKKRVALASWRGQTFSEGVQAQKVITSITHEFCGSEQLASALGMMVPGQIAKPHMHQDHESIIVVIEGWAATVHGPEFETVLHGPGDFVFVPEKVMHFAVNLSDTHRLVFVEVRSEKHYNEDVVLQPEYLRRAMAHAQKLRRQFARGELALPKGWQQAIGRPFTLPGVGAPGPNA